MYMTNQCGLVPYWSLINDSKQKRLHRQFEKSCIKKLQLRILDWLECCYNFINSVSILL